MMTEYTSAPRHEICVANNCVLTGRSAADCGLERRKLGVSTTEECSCSCHFEAPADAHSGAKMMRKEWEQRNTFNSERIKEAIYTLMNLGVRLEQIEIVYNAERGEMSVRKR